MRNTKKKGSRKLPKVKTAKSQKATKSPKKRKKPMTIKSTPKKKQKREMGVEKACGFESDRIGSLILTSRGDFSESKIQKNVSVGATPVKTTPPVDKGASAVSTVTDVRVTKESGSAVTGLTLADKSASTTSPEYIVNTDYEIDSDQYNFGYSNYPMASPSSSVSSAHVHTLPSSFYESSPVASSTYPMPFSPFHPPPLYMLSHSQSWPPNNQVSLFFMLYDI